MSGSDVPVSGQPFDAAPFARALPEGNGLIWDDPRELHEVRATFAGPVPGDLKLEYWRGKWPQVRLPKDHVEGRGSAGWWQLGDWFNGEWRTADAETRIEGNTATFTFRPLNATEFPDETDFPATFRTTMKVRLVSAAGATPVGLVAVTDSVWERQTVTVVLADTAAPAPEFQVFNGHLDAAEAAGAGRYNVSLWGTANPDPNTFDKTLLSIIGAHTVTVSLEDVQRDPVWVPDFGLCVVAGEGARDYAALCAAVMVNARAGIYDMVAELPEQSWRRAWDNMVPKRGRMSLPLAPDGSRHKFGLQPDGSLRYRTNNEVLLKNRGADSDRLASDAANLHLSFGLPAEPASRTIADGVLPIGITTWATPAGTIEQVAFATILAGTDPDGPAPDADAGGACLMRFTFCGSGEFLLPVRCDVGDKAEELRCDESGLIWSGDKLRALIQTGGRGTLGADAVYSVTLSAGEGHSIVVKVAYVAPTPDEITQLQALDFDRERQAVGDTWRRNLHAGAQLITPETDLNEFYTAVAGHSLINSELEPNSRRRFARAGSFGYLAFANESCMMITDLDRRGMHEAARECLEGFLHYQGTVPLPGDFVSQEGVLYGAGGYEHIGYNQHHGWILWCLVEHYRFTRDEAWLRSVAGNILAAAEWIMREIRAHDERVPADSPEAGLLPPGNLEDITDWWPWLSTNCYTWRGLAAAAWALRQTGHPAADEVQEQADRYRAAILDRFTRAAERAPVVRLRNGTCVPHFPSTVYRRGRAFGWICETLEGAIHLLITGVMDPHSREAEWIINDFEDNLYLSEQYGYCIEDYDRHWFDWGGFSMQACLLLNVEPYLYRDDVKHALRAAFNAIAAQYHPDTRMGAEHALPELGDWRGDHYKSPDEANACGWLRYLFVREADNTLHIGQAVPESWLQPGCRCGIERTATHFGEVSALFEAREGEIVVHLDGPRRNPPASILVDLRTPEGWEIKAKTVNGQPSEDRWGSYVFLPGDIGQATIVATLGRLGEA